MFQHRNRKRDCCMRWSRQSLFLYVSIFLKEGESVVLNNRHMKKKL
ncbi:hypothetical protein RUMHYD_03791 [Blautia hydrogenotrophica DSM 10507]|uniref:Uncharacterized protein n=1 Tax=Blautia hydrogenotrophica (strain DSM 10507 / JCM 14656 / S5a33) TaxID=476272 RepID=C0CSC4_BLAHS|nr:hypothetical protein RUMHYD_03791 [Blautia hydrogenotrophica DSM 10507]